MLIVYITQDMTHKHAWHLRLKRNTTRKKKTQMLVGNSRYFNNKIHVR